MNSYTIVATTKRGKTKTYKAEAKNGTLAGRSKGFNVAPGKRTGVTKRGTKFTIRRSA